ncbi:hypothetical protein HJC10_29020 [Corallococcus exiguus]|uniref:hypothetical protein n=1 Tax=Corallococcus TaxID=83461 RepID=UPI000EF72CD6|nr:MULTISPECIES: hypothetical protein [Corallococcus]NNB89288.1 hypothetical protein [Corallococcus exiguus]NNB99253.1 hypothetical protein [Corallococcus exiguus]NNC06880.1 hypothetical protein [Corallococcus exiguus]NPC50673.1 hypothetical protein [Corallococcus exiguus]
MSTPPKTQLPLPPEPPELKEKRDKLLAELDVQGKTAQGTFLQVVRNMRKLVAASAPGTPLDEGMYKDVTDSLNRFMKDPILPPPAILGHVVEYLQYRISTYGMTIQSAVMEMNPELGAKFAVTPPVAAPAAPAAPARGAAGGHKTSDGFENSSRPKIALTREDSLPGTAKPADTRAESQQQLDSFKAWMKNPALGKLKG